MSMKKEIGLHLRQGNGLKLPLKKSPVRFAVMNKNGLSSNAWRVWTEKAGDVYIACRDNMKDLHVSLHQSGQQHIAVETELGHGVVDFKQHWGQWSEPPHYGPPHIAPSFQLLFPNWALSLPYATRLTNTQVWDKNQILVETDDHNPLTVVDFYVIEKGVTISFGDVHPSYPLAVLPLPTRPNRKLWVIASQQPEGNIKEIAQRAITKINLQGLNKKEIQLLKDGNILSAFCCGPTTEQCMYGIVLPLKFHVT